MLLCTFRYRTAAHLHFMEAAAAQLDVMRVGIGRTGYGCPGGVARTEPLERLNLGGVPSIALGGVLRRPGEGFEWRVLRRRVRAAIAPESRCGALAAYRVWWRVGWYRRITAVSADGRGIDGGRSAAALLERPQHNLTLA